MRRRLVSRLLFLLDGLGRRGDEAPPEQAAPAPIEDLPEDSTTIRPEGLLLWLHAANAEDAGPLPAVAQELSRLRGEPVNALLTATRGTSSPGIRSAIIQAQVPNEGTSSVRAFFDKWSPDVCMGLGLPDRPALLGAARERALPMFLAFPERGIAERRIPMLPSSLLHLFDTCLAPSGQDARLLRAGLKDQDIVITTGPLSDTALTLPCDEVELGRVAGLLASRPVWMVHHPREGEFAAIEAAHRIAARSAHRLLLIIVPTPGEDGSRIAAYFEQEGWRTARQSNDQDPLSEVQVFVADGEGDGAPAGEDIWFRIAPIVFCGGTLSGGAASDPFRAAAHGTAIIHGPITAPEDRRFQKLMTAGASWRIDSADDLGAAVARLMSPDTAADLALAGWSVISESAQVIDRLARMMDEAIDRAEAQMARTR